MEPGLLPQGAGLTSGLVADLVGVIHNKKEVGDRAEARPSEGKEW